jgi:hypothetical protein
MKIMKYIYLSSLMIALSAFFLIGCENAEYKAQSNSLYITDAAGTNNATTVTMDDGADINVVVRLAQKVMEDVEVEIQFSPELLAEYNATSGTEYEVLPADMLPKNATVIIPAGEISANYRLHVDDFVTNGITYAIPLTLGNVIKGNIVKSKAQSKFIYVLAKPLNVSVPVLRGNAGNVTTLPETDWGITVDAWTLEAWVRMDGYSINNQAIFTSGSNDHEVYIRFGDANRPYNYLQIKSLGGQKQTASDLEANTWYHWAFVYNGTTLTIYRNGKQDTFFDPPAPKGGSVRFDFMKIVDSGSYFRNNCAMSQVRLWKVARTESEIANNMYFEVNPKNPNLIALWPMDEGDGTSFRDATGNGHNATSNGALQRWEHNIRFDK